ncbi:acyl-coenzyme A synthetase ACSM1, mitochondrial-like isoform X1 [Cebus imitator]|uniref:acyl-coenzyme A synthetase ACSM1, mitochondrial-like isoform X1 n=1 Tax=Cebus imitator TaxID=2715852 RepID=UPI00080A35D6|nr:acyl-coenzyme A synthetase ACSM1, mitochondrial-like isoform X1 [Cebus imitator]
MGRFFNVAASEEISPISMIEEYSALDVYCSFLIPSSMDEQVMKAFIVLTPQFLSHDKDQLIKELQQHVTSVTAPYKYLRKHHFRMSISCQVDSRNSAKDPWPQSP